ncbi:hypothetical protein CR513_35224, partial [Mucuna pruriens]
MSTLARKRYSRSMLAIQERPTKRFGVVPKNENQSISKPKRGRSSLGTKGKYRCICMDLVDMLGIDLNFLCYHLSISLGACSISQKKRRLGEEKKRAVRAETTKMLQARFIREVKYPSWLSNVVMVKKPSGKWRIYIDYTDLNRTCPKDLYPLPSIDVLVDGASGCGLLSFMEAYSGYNQIRMHPSDKSKTTFITNKGNFCYRVMPFGLKNVGATYQRLMDRIFKDHVENQLEVYVDDMVVKSKIKKRHAKNLVSIFRVLRKYQLRLNLEKCSFGIKVDIKFGDHPGRGRTNLPIKQILRKPDLVGRMIGWAIELFELDMAYKTRGHMKAQVLTDFINKLTTNSLEEEEVRANKEWTLSVDGSSNKKGSGVGITLEGPGGVLIE